MGKRDLNECISIDIEPLCVKRKRKTERASKKEGENQAGAKEIGRREKEIEGEEASSSAGKIISKRERGRKFTEIGKA